MWRAFGNADSAVIADIAGIGGRAAGLQA